MIVSVLGAAGGVGQSTILLLKTTLPAGTELRLIDMNPAIPGIALDLSHIPTAISVRGFLLADLAEALPDSDIVLIMAGVPRKPGMTRADLFTVNARIVADLMSAIAEYCPAACIGIVTNPVNSLVPLAAKVLEQKGVYVPEKLFGVTNLDSLRARVLLSTLLGKNSEELEVEVIGGHSAETMVPVFGKLLESENISSEQKTALYEGVQAAGTKVVEAKAGAGSATLSMGYAAAEFVNFLIQGLSGNSVNISAYVPTIQEAVPFFAKPILLGTVGRSKELPYGPLNTEEEKMLQQILPVLRAEIATGENFMI